MVDADDDARLEAALVKLLSQRGEGKTICPSEVLSPEEKQDAVRMRAVRAAARRLRDAGVLEVLQRGAVVDPDRARGPIRLRLRQSRGPISN